MLAVAPAEPGGIRRATSSAISAARPDITYFFQAEDGIRVHCVTGFQTCALPIYQAGRARHQDRHSRPPPLGTTRTTVHDDRVCLSVRLGASLRLGRAMSGIDEQGARPVIKQTPVKGSKKVKVNFVLPRTRRTARCRWSATPTTGT